MITYIVNFLYQMQFIIGNSNRESTNSVKVGIGTESEYIYYNISLGGSLIITP